MSDSPPSEPLCRMKRLDAFTQRCLDHKAFLAAVLLFGVALRLIQYLVNRSLWHDEAQLALGIIEKPFSAFFEPLGRVQLAPVGFLALEKTAVLALGGSEYVLRLFPLLFGLASLFIFLRLARTVLPLRGALLALVLFVAADRLIWYSSEVKQYSLDVFATIAALGTAIWYHSKPASLWRALGLGLLGAAAVWFSQPSAFVLAGAGISLAIGPFRRREWKNAVPLGLVAALWLASAAGCVFVMRAQMRGQDSLYQYWRDYFMPVPPRSLDDLHWFTRTFFGIFDNPVGIPLTGIAALLAIIGAVSLFKRDAFSGWLLLLPVAATLFASALRMYPFGDRLLLFLVPIFLILIAAGGREIAARTYPSMPLLTWMLLALLLLFPATFAARYLIKQRPEEEIKTALEYMRQRRGETDVVYVYYGAEPAFQYYAARYGFREGDCVHGVMSRAKWSGYISDLKQVEGRERVWVLFSHAVVGGESEFILDHLDAAGVRLDAVQAPGASAYMYDLRAPPGR
jgi:hypothetical protein